MQVPSGSVLEQLAKILAGSTFEGAHRAKAMLEFVVKEAVAGRTDPIKEYTIGVAVFERPESFDPRTDPIVRAEASRLRAKLEAYYASEGQADRVVIALPRGTYVPQFSLRSEPEGKGSARPVGWIVAMVVGVAALVVLALKWSPGSEPQGQAMYLNLELRTSGTVASQAGPDFVLSPDGSKIAFIAIETDGTPRLHLKRLDRFEDTVLEGTEGVRAPFFSPDGNAVAFWAGGRLKKVFPGGGAATVLCEATDLLGGSWGDDGYIVAAIERQKLARIPATGGAPETILDLTREGRVPAWPQVLGGSKRIIYTSLGFEGADRGRIEVLERATGRSSTLAMGATYGRMLMDRWLLYVNQSTVYAQELQPGGLKAVGEPMPTTMRVPYSATFGYAQYDVTQIGTFVCRRTSGLGEPRWLSEVGEPGAALLPAGRYVQPAIARDGSRVAIAETVSGQSRVLVRNRDGEIVTRLGAPAQFPVWSPDGEYLVLGAMPHLAWVRADGTGGMQRLTQSTRLQSAGSFSPDGRTLAYAEFDPKSGFDLWTVPVERRPEGLVAGTPVPYLQSAAFETHPVFSPDGKWIAYASNESGGWEVYVRAYPENGFKLQVSTGGGRVPRWSPHRPQIYVRTDQQGLMRVTYAVRGGRMEIRATELLKSPTLADTGVLANFDVGPDGRVLAILPARSGVEEETPNHVSLVLSFGSELERLKEGRRGKK